MTKDGSLEDEMFSGTAPVYRLTDSGWNAIHRTHVQALLAVIVALIGLMLSVNWVKAVGAAVGLLR